MAILFYTASGSVPGWKVQLTLEHKQIPYELKMLSHQDGDFKKPNYLAINPRGTVPAITDGDFVLWESSVICEYLDEKWPERPILPREPVARARVKRIAAEASFKLHESVIQFGDAIFGGTPGSPNLEIYGKAHEKCTVSVGYLDGDLRGPFFGDESPSLADFTVYPILAMARRLATRFKLEPVELGAKLGEWMKRMEALPYYDKTYPPHWR